MFTRLFLVLFAFLSLCPPAGFAQDAGKGEKLFNRKCKGCHRLSKGVKMGPGLAGVTKRRSEEWLDRWLQNPKAMLKSGDPIAVEMLKKYKKRMPRIKAMQNEDNRKDIIAFLKKHDEGEQE